MHNEPLVRNLSNVCVNSQQTLPSWSLGDTVFDRSRGVGRADFVKSLSNVCVNSQQTLSSSSLGDTV